MTVTLDQTASQNGQATIYINRFAKSAATGVDGQTGDDSAETAYLANDYSYGPLNGLADEFRVSNVVRSPDWIATEYNNQSAPSLFYEVNPENIVSSVPSTVALYASQTEQFSAIAPCSALFANWWMPAGSPGTLTTGGLYTAPDSITTQQTVTITATNQTNGSNIGTSLVTLLPPVSVTVTPASATIGAWQTQQFTGSVANANNMAVAWTISPAGMGTIDQTGLYVPPTGGQHP